jgi:peptidoglycan/LPS O-acetylase OafA/YrhL
MQSAVGPGLDGGYSSYAGTKSFGSLDGLRAIAILAVVWHHTGPPFPGWPISARGFLGVDLFFVISGFLIVTLLLRERRRTATISLRKFYGRRFLRIFPAYYAMLLLAGTIAFVKHGNTSEAVRADLPYAALYVSNLVPMHSMLAITWSLSVEEQFYLIIPALEKYARRALPLILPAAYVLVSLPTFGLFPGLGLPSFFRETTFGPILLGVMLAHLLDQPSGYRWVSRVLGRPEASAVALALVVLAVSYPHPDISGWHRIGIHWLLAALVAACVVREQHGLRAILSCWPMRRIGIVSYGIYLYHQIVAHFAVLGLERFHVSSHLSMFATVTVFTWLTAELSYRLFESRFLALKQRFVAA